MKFAWTAALAALLALSSCGTDNRYFRNLPDGCDPETVGRAITEQFLTATPEAYAPVGYDGALPVGQGVFIAYNQVIPWYNGMEFADLVGDTSLLRRLLDSFEPYMHEKKRFQPQPNHVDMSIFGALAYEVWMKGGPQEALALGDFYADRQWSEPDPESPGGNGNGTVEEQLEWLRNGYSPQTRLWIDDMYMITALQTQAFRAKGDRKYVDRAAKEMVFYLHELQNPDGLFYHAPDVPFAWCRGNGWMAAGMSLLLKYLPEDSPFRPEILEGYRTMMAALLKWQREDGLWGQIIDDPGFWTETSGSAMFTFAFIEGIRNGWLEAGTYGPAARKAWIELCGKLDAHGNLAGVCEGTNRMNSREWYMNRARVNGDPHGQGAMLWICNALLEGS